MTMKQDSAQDNAESTVYIIQTDLVKRMHTVGPSCCMLDNSGIMFYPNRNKN